MVERINETGKTEIFLFEELPQFLGTDGNREVISPL